MRSIDGEYMIEVATIKEAILSYFAEAESYLAGDHIRRADDCLTQAWALILLLRKWFLVPALDNEHTRLCIAVIERERQLDKKV